MSNETNDSKEKKEYIMLMLLDSYEACCGEISKNKFIDLIPDKEKAKIFYQEVEMMFGITAPELGFEPIRQTIDRIYEKEKDEIMTADEFVEDM